MTARPMAAVTAMPKRVRVFAALALLWNLLGCLAYLADVTMDPAAVARLPAPEQAMHAAYPAWAVAATAVAVWGGALGSLGLLLGRRWALPLLAASLLGVIVQDIALFGMFGHLLQAAGSAVMAMQALVLLVAIVLVVVARRGVRRRWLR